MDTNQQRAALTLCLMAAMSDGHNDETERAELRRVAESIGAQGSIDAGTVIPSVRAVFALITNSNVVGCSIGKSLGLAPIRIF